MPEFGARTTALEVVEGVCLKGKDAIVTGNKEILKIQVSVEILYLKVGLVVLA